MKSFFIQIEELEKNGTEAVILLVHKPSTSCTTRGTLVGEDFLDERKDFVTAFFQKCIGNITYCFNFNYDLALLFNSQLN